MLRVQLIDIKWKNGSFYHLLLCVQADGEGFLLLRHVQQHEAAIEGQDQLLIVRKQVNGAIESFAVKLQLAVEGVPLHPFHPHQPFNLLVLPSVCDLQLLID